MRTDESDSGKADRGVALHSCDRNVQKGAKMAERGGRGWKTGEKG